MDDKLNYDEHVQSISNSLIKYFGIFNHIKYKVNDKLQGNFTLNSCSLDKSTVYVYGNCSERNINKLQTMQNKRFKLLLYLDRLTPEIFENYFEKYIAMMIYDKMDY